jgi:DNA-3-methyladenine glycosylase II
MTHSKSPDYWQQAQTELSASDPVMARIIEIYRGENLQSKEDAFHTLARSITGQQISVKAADAIWGRLEAQLLAISRQLSVNPKNVAMVDDDALRACGYSWQKISYIRSLSAFFLTYQHRERDWAQMSDEEVIQDLIQIKGIGRWTAEMFLIFHLLRPNVFPIDDLGVLKAIRLHYPEQEWSRKAYLTCAEQWQPWRSVATWYLWRSLDPVPVAY